MRPAETRTVLKLLSTLDDVEKVCWQVDKKLYMITGEAWNEIVRPCIEAVQNDKTEVVDGCVGEWELIEDMKRARRFQSVQEGAVFLLGKYKIGKRDG